MSRLDYNLRIHQPQEPGQPILSLILYVSNSHSDSGVIDQNVQQDTNTVALSLYQSAAEKLPEQHLENWLSQGSAQSHVSSSLTKRTKSTLFQIRK